MSSPFKFLDAYTREDRDQFFGREEETTQLYELVNQNRLVLVYGPSGTGKTSLIQCGLGNRFDATDWLPLFIRRGTHLPTSLQKALTDHWDEELEVPFWEADENPLPTIIEDVFAEYLRPIYLVFDQLEEIFILGNEDEQRIFTQAMADIYDAKLPCRLIFILREEYLAHLYDFEKRIPTLFKRRLRVEAMSAQQAEEVVSRSCEKFNIKLEEPTKNPGQIIKKVSSGKSGVPLPYLQVYLDRLYREDFSRTYPGKDLRNLQDFVDLPALEFTTQEIDEFGEIGDVLKAFLQEQTQVIEEDLRADSAFKNLPERIVRKVLSAFATLKGTKIPQLRKNLKIAPLNDLQLDAILDRLRQARILREEDGTYELAHDTLAEEIANQRSAGEQALLEITEFVQSRSRAFKRTNIWLDTKELQLIETYEKQLREDHKLKPDEWKFIEESQHEAQKKKQAKNRLTAGIIGVLSILLVLAAWQWKEAEAAKEVAVQNEQRADSLSAVQRVKDSLALVQSEKAKKLAEEERRKAQQALIGFYDEKLKAAKSEYRQSVQRLDEAERLYATEPEIIRNRRQQVGQKQTTRDDLQHILDSLNLAIQR